MWVPCDRIRVFILSLFFKLRNGRAYVGQAALKLLYIVDMYKIKKNNQKTFVVMLLMTLIYNPPATVFCGLGIQACSMLGSCSIGDQVQSPLQDEQVHEA